MTIPAFMHDRDPGPPDVVDSHCCGCNTKEGCIDSRGAAGLREHLTVLTREVHDGYNNDVEGGTPLERIGYALDRIDDDSARFATLVFIELERWTGQLTTLAATIPVCDLKQLCLDCQGKDGPGAKREAH